MRITASATSEVALLTYRCEIILAAAAVFPSKNHKILEKYVPKKLSKTKGKIAITLSAARNAKINKTTSPPNATPKKIIAYSKRG
jgi:hypothetical protein